MLTKNQFDVLDEIIESKKILSQKELAARMHVSVGNINKVVGELNKLGFLNGSAISEKGKMVMEPFRVKRAVIIAAGFGSRLVPVTLSTPKPLVRVNGRRIVDTVLDALTDAEIEEIYLVRGYLAEQFNELQTKYPKLKFIENPLYNEANNISSVYFASDHLCGTYIIEADLLLTNKSLIRKYQYQSNYLAIPVEKTDDWCFYVRNGIIKKMTIGGQYCHQMVGISYWTEQDGKLLAEDIKTVFLSPRGKERYWDQVPLECCIDRYKVGVRECSFDDIVEIDTFLELKAIDESYNTY